MVSFKKCSPWYAKGANLPARPFLPARSELAVLCRCPCPPPQIINPLDAVCHHPGLVADPLLSEIQAVHQFIPGQSRLIAGTLDIIRAPAWLQPSWIAGASFLDAPPLPLDTPIPPFASCQTYTMDALNKASPFFETGPTPTMPA